MLHCTPGQGETLQQRLVYAIDSCILCSVRCSYRDISSIAVKPWRRDLLLEALLDEHLSPIQFVWQIVEVNLQ